MEIAVIVVTCRMQMIVEKSVTQNISYCNDSLYLKILYDQKHFKFLELGLWIRQAIELAVVQ